MQKEIFSKCAVTPGCNPGDVHVSIAVPNFYRLWALENFHFRYPINVPS